MKITSPKTSKTSGIVELLRLDSAVRINALSRGFSRGIGLLMARTYAADVTSVPLRRVLETVADDVNHVDSKQEVKLAQVRSIVRRLQGGKAAPPRCLPQLEAEIISGLQSLTALEREAFHQFYVNKVPAAKACGPLGIDVERFTTMRTTLRHTVTGSVKVQARTSPTASRLRAKWFRWSTGSPAALSAPSTEIRPLDDRTGR
jgi:hypothetical protein